MGTEADVDCEGVAARGLIEGRKRTRGSERRGVEDLEREFGRDGSGGDGKKRRNGVVGGLSLGLMVVRSWLRHVRWTIEREGRRKDGQLGREGRKRSSSFFRMF